MEGRCHEAPFSPRGWHPATPEGKEEVVSLSLFLLRAANGKTQPPPNFSQGTEQTKEWKLPNVTIVIIVRVWDYG